MPRSKFLLVRRRDFLGLGLAAVGAAGCYVVEAPLKPDGCAIDATVSDRGAEADGHSESLEVADDARLEVVDTGTPEREPDAPMLIPPTPTDAIVKGMKVHVIGDSISTGSFTWVEKLKIPLAAALDETGAAMNLTVTNAGIVGYQMQQLAGSLDTLFDPFDPDFVILEASINNYTQTLTQAQTNCLTLLDAVKARKPRVRTAFIGAIWRGETWAQSGVAPPTWNNPSGADTFMDAQLIPGVRLACAQRGVQFWDLRSYMLKFQPTDNASKAISGLQTQDQIHPTALGQQRMSDGAFAQMSFSSTY